MPLRASFLALLLLTACASTPPPAPGPDSAHRPDAQPEPDRTADIACSHGAELGVCRQLAAAMLDPKNPKRSPAGALALLQAGCRTGDPVACEVVQAHFDDASALTPVAGVVARADDPSALARQGVVQCKVAVDGRLVDCKVKRSGGASADAAILQATSHARYVPAGFRGEAFESYVYLRYPPSSDRPDGGA